MADVLLFNHVPKTAGMSLRYVLWRVVGRERVLTHNRLWLEDRLGGIVETLDRPLDDSYVVQSHFGPGIEARLPSRHAYRSFTFLREPLARTTSTYDMVTRVGQMPEGMGFTDFLEEHPTAFNLQTLFFSGAWEDLHTEAPGRGQSDQQLLAQAKQALESHAVIGLTERFDDSLLMLRDAFGWPAWKTLYRRANVGRPPSLGASELKAVEAANELDLELYAFGRELFASRLAGRTAKAFSALNRAAQATYSLTALRRRGSSAERAPAA